MSTLLWQFFALPDSECLSSMETWDDSQKLVVKVR